MEDEGIIKSWVVKSEVRFKLGGRIMLSAIIEWVDWRVGALVRWKNSGYSIDEIKNSRTLD